MQIIYKSAKTDSSIMKTHGNKTAKISFKCWQNTEAILYENDRVT